MPIIELKNLSFCYEGFKKKSLSNINFKVEEGEFVLVCGESGCGKTTLTRCINGLIPHFYEGKLQGECLIEEKDIKTISTCELAGLVGSVFQDPRSQFFTTNTSDEVAFGCENLGIQTDEIQRRAKEAFTDTFTMHLKEQSIFNLSSGEKQRIAIASVYALKPMVIVLDEPSANLDFESICQLHELLGALKKMGHTIIISEHRLFYVADLADHIVYMKDGSIGEHWSKEEFSPFTSQELHNYGLRETDLRNLTTLRRSPISCASASHALEVKNLTVTRGKRQIIKDVQFSVDKEASHIIGIIGNNGIGKTSMVRSLCGLSLRQEGQLSLNGKILAKNKRLKNMFFVMQDADYQLFTGSVYDELCFGHKKTDELDKRIDDLLAKFSLTEYKYRHPQTLSGGQKQRVTILAALLSNADILFFDEPTSGLDWKNMDMFCEILRDIEGGGKQIFVITHDYEFLLKTCSRFLLLEEQGRLNDFILDNHGLELLKKVFKLD